MPHASALRPLTSPFATSTRYRQRQPCTNHDRWSTTGRRNRWMPPRKRRRVDGRIVLIRAPATGKPMQGDSDATSGAVSEGRNTGQAGAVPIACPGRNRGPGCGRTGVRPAKRRGLRRRRTCHPGTQKGSTYASKPRGSASNRRRCHLEVIARTRTRRNAGLRTRPPQFTARGSPRPQHCTLAPMASIVGCSTSGGGGRGEGAVEPLPPPEVKVPSPPLRVP